MGLPRPSWPGCARRVGTASGIRRPRRCRRRSRLLLHAASGSRRGCAGRARSYRDDVVGFVAAEFAQQVELDLDSGWDVAATVGDHDAVEGHDPTVIACDLTEP